MGVEESVTVDNESGEEDREMEIKTNDSIIGLDNVVKYIQQNNLGISASLMKDLQSLKRLIIYKSVEKKKQATLEIFIDFNID